MRETWHTFGVVLNPFEGAASPPSAQGASRVERLCRALGPALEALGVTDVQFELSENRQRPGAALVVAGAFCVRETGSDHIDGELIRERLDDIRSHIDGLLAASGPDSPHWP